jgi:protein FAM50
VEREVEEQRQRAARQLEEEQLRAQGKKRQAAKVTATARLSFVDAEEEEEEEEDAAPPVAEPGSGAEQPQGAPSEGEQANKRLRFGCVGKNPGVDTTFLPDRDRERQEREERERLKREWAVEQQRLQAEALQITFSYWDGSGHRRSITVKRGDTVGAFLRGVRDALSPEFRELRSASVDNMLYVKEDLIIPHSLTFHELIVSKARGKSGPLFHFDVHEDIRLVADARKEKDEAHAGKVLERHWYDKNKHIFPVRCRSATRHAHCRRPLTFPGVRVLASGQQVGGVRPHQGLRELHHPRRMSEPACAMPGCDAWV